MQKFVIEYVPSDDAKNSIHPSWYKICEEQTKDEIIKMLKKHLYDGGRFVLNFYVYPGYILRKTDAIFGGWLLRIDNKLNGGLASAGSIRFNYYDNSLDDYDYKTSWPKMDCTAPLTNPTAQFTVSNESSIYPSPKEFEIMCEKSTERFVKRINNSVNFPLDIVCDDYPDVIFEICYNCKIEQQLISDTIKVIEDYVKKYNKRHDVEIHYVAEASDGITCKKSNTAYVHVDFGNCDIDALALVVKAIGKSKLPIKEMTLL